MSIVVQGFGPFAGRPDNPSRRLVGALAARHPELHGEVIDTSVRVALDAVPDLVRRHRPEIWVGVGLAAGRTALGIEAVAVNLADWASTAADVEGVSVVRQPIAPQGPDAYLTTLPVTDVLAAWRALEVPGFLSLSAGSYLCNLSFYLAAHAAAAQGLECRVGFIHVPLTPDLVADPAREPSMAFDDALAGLEAALDACRHAPPGTGLYAGPDAPEDGTGAVD